MSPAPSVDTADENVIESVTLTSDFFELVTASHGI